ncbi:3-dehydroquinate synthase [Rosistilla carotiformis]|uniref:3-dehydroquinate synthase n=1 Tax=Rosistilla carotiformis TaxID=2528017 RepID=A0A518JRX5_9BACT|nr:3-dehydroquinate synthase [Rosistilla carotiformis]QDV68280.1 3-dehydroquinate synthase [Rosistilla carotiformis]
MLMKSSDSIDISFSLPLVQRLRFTADVFGDDSQVLTDLLEPSGDMPARAQIWLDQHVADANPGIGHRIVNTLNAANDHVLLTQPPQVIAGGEASKNDPAIIDNLLRNFNDHDLDRRSYVIVIGGGAVLDAVGYAASIAHRGIRLIRIPTTTLAQADSGVGVKNAVNWFGKKNWKGTFAVPWGVINDAKILETLPDRDYRCGFSEVVKVSLLKQTTAFEQVCRDAEKICQRDPQAAAGAIRASVQMHLDHITRGGDPFETLEARPLDFGHWSAHRLESLTNYQLRHGEAVSIGLAIDCLYSARVLGLPQADCDRVLDCLQRLGLPIHHAALRDEDALLQGLEEFRQHLGGRLTITLIDAIGSPVDVHEIDFAAMRDAIAATRHLAQ